MTLDEEAFRLDGLPGPIADLDLDARGAWLAVCGPRWVVGSSDIRFELPRGVRFPRVRWIDSKRVLVVDTRTRGRDENASVFDRDGRELRRFFAGDGIKDVLVAGERIVVTYFDEGVFSDQRPAQEGVAVLRADGSLEFGYRSGARNPVAVWDCYCACLVGGQDLWFFPYDEFPLVRLSLDTFEQQVLQVPASLAGASALLVRDDTFWFHGTYDDPSGLFRWRPGEEPARIATHSGPLRGLLAGRFLSPGTSGYTLVRVPSR